MGSVERAEPDPQGIREGFPHPAHGLQRRVQGKCRLHCLEEGFLVGTGGGGECEGGHALAGDFVEYPGNVRAGNLAQTWVDHHDHNGTGASLRPASRPLLEEHPKILECLRTTGDDCYVMKVAATSMAHLEEIVDELAEFGSTTTNLVVSRTFPLCGPGCLE